jgi:CheY-like chemotaxis protein
VQGEKEARPGHYVVIEVEDTGTGMPPEVLSKIFTPFFTTKPVGKGTGLGLATVRDLAHNHNGFVQVRSQPGSGSRFLVFLPVAEPQASQPHSPESSPVPLGRGELVLVVDDEQYILKLARHILEAHGYRMIAASDGREALDLFARHKSGVRAAIIDMIMPTMDGATTVHILRSHQPRLPILMMSGTAMSESEAWLKQERVTFLPKPFTTQHLLAALDSILTGPRLS